MRGVVPAAFCLILTASSVLAGELARVGEASITSSDLAYRIATERAYGNDAVTQASALLSLVGDALESEAARLAGVTVTPAELLELSAHMDQTTRAPEALARVKEAFGQDQDAYRRLFVEPKATNPKLHAWFVANLSLNEPARQAAQVVLEQVLAGADLFEAASTGGLPVTTVTLDPSAQVPAGLPVASGPDPLLEAVAALVPGQVAPTLLEDEAAFRVIRLVERSGASVCVQVAASSKLGFDAWLRAQGATLGIQMLDPSLTAEVERRFPGLWWLQGTN